MIEKMQKTLTDNNVSFEYVSQDLKLPYVYYVRINGDWKHDHGRADYLMEQIGLIALGQKDFVEDGSDWYEATHTYVANQ